MQPTHTPIQSALIGFATLRSLEQPRNWLLRSCVICGLIALTAPLQAQSTADNASPWGIASGSEWSGDYPKFNPLLRDAGVTWLRYFPEWGSVQKKQGEFNWSWADKLLADTNANGMQLAGVFAYAAPWATTDGSTRTMPLKDNKHWRDYVAACAERYKGKITYWEVWNEFNGSFSKGGTPQIYADLTRDAYLTAKKIDPTVKIGISVANFDLAFIDAAIKAGAAGHFDFIAVHPYENMAAVVKHGGEMGFLSLGASLRKMLRDNQQDEKTPLWITEIGLQSSIQPDEERDTRQAGALVQCYVLSAAAGFNKVFWFEARGPSYGKGSDHGIIRADWSLRPVHQAFKTMTATLGATPMYLGWLNLNGAYAFLFHNTDNEPVLVTWSPLGQDTLTATFDAPVQVTDVLGKNSSLPAGQQLALTRLPQYITGLPPALVKKASANIGQPFPWAKDYAREDTVRVFLGATNREEGLKLTNLKTSEVVQGLDWTARQSKILSGGEGQYMYFRTDPSFAGFGDKNLEITVVARRADPDKASGMNLVYESMKGYKNIGKWWNIPAGEEWSEYTWKVDNANFVGQWSWNFRTEGGGSKAEFQIKEVRVKKLP